MKKLPEEIDSSVSLAESPFECFNLPRSARVLNEGSRFVDQCNTSFLPTSGHLQVSREGHYYI